MRQRQFQAPVPQFLLALPQMLIVFVFFYWPTGQALWWSVTLQRPFGGKAAFVGLENFQAVLSDPEFMRSLIATMLFTTGATFLALSGGLVLAVTADRKIRGNALLRNIIIWPYAISAPLAGIALSFLMSPQQGIFAMLNRISPTLWNPATSSTDAMIMVILAFAWLHVPFNFIVFLSGLQSIPDNYLQAAALDGAGPMRRAVDIQLPQLAPFVFLALVIDLTETLTNSFGIIDKMTMGDPAGATRILVYKIYSDGFRGLDLSGSATQSGLLMIFIVVMTIIQFRVVDRRISYER